MSSLGAHEVLELHEVLNDAIHGLNTLNLFRPYAQDHMLQAIMDRHIQVLTMEYNSMVQLANQQGAGQAVPARRMSAGMNPAINMNQTFQPMYGLHNPQTQAPARSAQEIDDVDVALCLVNCHKQTASLKMKAALEMANPTLRRTMQHGANTSADMAYEGFQFANQKGYYQVPTLKDTTQNTYLQSYGMSQTHQTDIPMV
ncbi:spore coat protein [Paenibacillus senegalensis]|uniref:spore coat protein n=1 Tax=Paenibacillus senegalensis TaxID=1465766 RepID=UPI000288F2AD|nr:spore coat protein [Paenibacillus senegalensis]